MLKKFISKRLMFQYIKFDQRCLKHSLVNEFDNFKNDLNLKEPIIDVKKILTNRNALEENIKLRKTKVDLDKIYDLYEKYEKTGEENVKSELLKLMLDLPNDTHLSSPRDVDYVVRNTLNEKREYDFKPRKFLNLTNKNNLCRTENISHYLGKRSYYFTGDLCLLENAVIQYVIDKLDALKFNFITVSDILHEDIIKRCGMNTRGKRSQVYHLEPEYYGDRWCLSGTAEMGIARYLMNKTVPRKELPLNIAAMSRCYRAEISDVGDEKGVFRVHCFTKIEMFGVTTPEESENSLLKFLEFEETIFSELGLYIRSLDMGINELGSQAFRKFDVEAWMPGRKRWGELSSCSDCTDYQSTRLNIRLDDDKYAHTINGTACAVPRLLMALLETHQKADGSISIPPCLHPYMLGKTEIGLEKGAPSLFKVKSSISKAKKKELAKAAILKATTAA